MRYYLIDSEKNESTLDLVQTQKLQNKTWRHVFKSDKKESEVFIRTLANKFYISFDQKKWSKLCQLRDGSFFNFVNNRFDLYRGFKPSGAMGGDLGALMTQMPGKVIKLLVKPGQEVKKGETLLILEAMKMENEIKSGMDGVVKTINVSEGQTVEQGHLLLELE